MELVYFLIYLSVNSAFIMYFSMLRLMEFVLYRTYNKATGKLKFNIFIAVVVNILFYPIVMIPKRKKDEDK